jgi:hypothetical protein
MPFATFRRLLFAVAAAIVVAGWWLCSAAPRLAAIPEAAARFSLFFGLLGLSVLSVSLDDGRRAPPRRRPDAIVPFTGEKIP